MILSAVYSSCFDSTRVDSASALSEKREECLIRKCANVLVVSISLMLTAPFAVACRTFADLELGDIRYADVVVIGKVENYHMVLDQAVRARRKATLEREPADSVYRQLLSKQTRFIGDYARFDVSVEEVLVGQPPAVISVTWNNSTFGEPETMSEGPYLIGLRESGSRIPPLRGPSATILPSPDPSSLTVLQAPCAPPFMFQVGSDQARAVRKMLATDGQ